MYGRRRVPGLRREEVAMLAGVSTDYYARLERGNLTGVSDSVLEAIARALQLDEAEQAHLHDLARTANATPRTRRRAASQQQISPQRAANPRRNDRSAGLRSQRASRHPFGQPARIRALFAGV